MKGFIKFLLGVLSAIFGFLLVRSLLDRTPVRNSSPITVYKSLSELNERQNKILQQITKSKILLPSEIYSIFPEVSTRTLRRDMNVLISKNLVIQEGSTKDTRYILNN
jgi:predicted HTH transcriptional regulator